MSQKKKKTRRARTEQEAFWAGTFGDDYIGRNRSDQLLAGNLALFSRILARARDVGSVIELGANIGMNLKALRALRPGAACTGVEINAKAAREMAAIPGVKAVRASLFDYEPKPHDLAFTKGVLIHLNPEMLPLAYDRLARAGRRYVAIIEYYNPAPVEVPYRGHSGRLFKRDFAGEFMERHPAFRLVDYGFVYRRDPVFPQDDLTWFLMERRGSR
ncbi:MAG TPA: pseudaminic acid biosynthesis-associated methylase [Kiritimatiellia bacterium]|nr:pseudaminic acid biosynthesis-associated methylase [Kiritimatiellia bacterium]HRZ11472.1 pseudaminic acid biosynthesis-associated methylase [Kiritimatiellia bacterium]HSA16977.1 pseudaminic acid biosynthesis-associated methylase [Kiritimatiellia bacterium]